MKSSFKGIFLILALLMLVGVVHAVPVESIQVTNCGLSTSGPLTCSQSITVSCDVVDAIGGSPAATIANVQVSINGVAQTLALTGGTYLNGTWSKTMTQGSSPITGTVATITDVNVIDSTKSSCVFSLSGLANPEQSIAGCYIGSFGTLSASINCSCSTMQTSVCYKNNTALITSTTSAGCSNPGTTVTHGICDYCKPEYVVNYGQCVHAPGSLTGTMTKTFVDDNGGYCCAQTGLASDCTVPSASEVSCSQDLWSTQGRDVGQSGKSDLNTGILTSSVASTTAVIDAFGNGLFQPLVGDWANNGNVGTLVQNRNNFKVFSSTGSVMYSFDMGTNYWQGQASIYGMTRLRNGIVVSSDDVSSGTKGLGVAGIVADDNTGEYYFKIYQFRPDLNDFAETFSYQLSHAIRVSTGVTCVKDICYFMDAEGALNKVNAVSQTKINPSAGYVNNANSVPSVIVWADNDVTKAVVVSRVAKSNVPYISVCNIDASVCQEFALSGLITATWENVTDPINFGYTISDPIYGTDVAQMGFSYMDSDNTTSVAKIMTFDVKKVGGISVLNFVVTSPSNIGGKASCITNLAGMNCGGNSNSYGVIAHYIPTDIVDVNSWATAQTFTGSDQDAASPLTQFVGSIVGGYPNNPTSSLGKSICGGNICYMMSATTSNIQCPTFCYYAYGDDFSVSKYDGGLWSNVNLPQVFNSTYNGSEVFSTGTGYEYGMIGEDLYVLGSYRESSGARDVILWKVTSSGVVTKLFEQLNATALMYSAVTDSSIVPKLMACDAVNNFCTVALTGRIIKISSAGLSVIEPQGILSGYDVSAANIYGYAETTSYRYFAVGGNGKGYVLRYDVGDLSSPTIVESNSDDGISYLGLSSVIGQNSVFYVKVPTYSSNTECSYDKNASANIIFRSGSQTLYGDSNIGGSNTKYYSCNFTMKSGIGGANTVLKDTVDSVVGSPVADRTTYQSGIDSAGKRFILFNYKIGNRYVGNPSAANEFTTTMGFSERSGLFFPHLTNVLNVSDLFTWVYGGNDVCLNITSNSVGSGCRPVVWDAYANTEANQNVVPVKIEGYSMSSSNSNLVLRNILSGPVSRVDTISSSGESSVGSYDIMDCYRYSRGQSMIVATATKNTDFCTSRLSAGDADADGRTDYVTSEGIYKQENGLKLVNGINNFGYGAMLDLNSDGYGDYLSITPYELKLVTSVPSLTTITPGSNLSVQSLSCIYDDSTRSLTVNPIGVTSQNPDKTYFQASYTTSPNVGIDHSGSTLEPQKTFTLISSATYNVDMIATDVVTGEHAYASCSISSTVSAPIWANSTGFNGDSTGACAIGYNNIDGGFNYVDAVTSHNWVTNTNGGSIVLTGSSAKMLPSGDNSISLTHTLGCDKSSLSMEAKFKYDDTTNSQRSDFMLQQDSGYSPTPTGYFYSIVSGGIMKIYAVSGTEGPLQIYTSDNPTNWTTVKVVVDRVLGKQSYYVNGVGMLTTDVTNLANGQFSVVLLNGNANLEVDYIQVGEASGSSIIVQNATQEEMGRAVVNLAQCKTAAEVYDAQGYDPHSNSTQRIALMAHVKAYCDTISGGCDYSKLNTAIRINSNCYSEAYQYCVQVVYPREQGNDDAIAAGIPTQQTGADGASVCAGVLTTSAGANRIVVPIFNSIWKNIIVPNWYYIAAVLAFLILLAAIRRK
jgi:hypothetical protein